MKIEFIEDYEIGGYTVVYDNIISEGETKEEAFVNINNTIFDVKLYELKKKLDKKYKK